MTPGQASRTAEYAAGFRALETVRRPARARLFEDPLADRVAPADDPVSYLGADLTREDLSHVLATAGIDRAHRVFVLWEGVTHYLGGDAVDTTLRTLARAAAPGSQVTFTYLHRGLLDGTAAFDGARASRDQVAHDGEPWIWGWDPAQLAGYLEQRGMTLRRDAGADEYRARYWGERGRRMRGFGFYHVALAEVDNGATAD